MTKNELIAAVSSIITEAKEAGKADLSKAWDKILQALQGGDEAMSLSEIKDWLMHAHETGYELAIRWLPRIIVYLEKMAELTGETGQQQAEKEVELPPEPPVETPPVETPPELGENQLLPPKEVPNVMDYRPGNVELSEQNAFEIGYMVGAAKAGGAANTLSASRTNDEVVYELLQIKKALNEDTDNAIAAPLVEALMSMPEITSDTDTVLTVRRLLKVETIAKNAIEIITGSDLNGEQIQQVISYIKDKLPEGYEPTAE